MLESHLGRQETNEKITENIYFHAKKQKFSILFLKRIRRIYVSIPKKIDPSFFGLFVGLIWKKNTIAHFNNSKNLQVLPDFQEMRLKTDSGGLLYPKTTEKSRKFSLTCNIFYWSLKVQPTSEKTRIKQIPNVQTVKR